MRRVENEAATEKRWLRAAEWLEAVDKGKGLGKLGRGALVDIRFKLSTEDDPMVLMIVRASEGEQRYVAFVGAGDPVAALLAWRKRDGQGGLKWRIDKPYGQRTGG